MSFDKNVKNIQQKKNKISTEIEQKNNFNKLC